MPAVRTSGATDSAGQLRPIGPLSAMHAGLPGYEWERVSLDRCTGAMRFAPHAPHAHVHVHVHVLEMRTGEDRGRRAGGLNISAVGRTG